MNGTTDGEHLPNEAGRPAEPPDEDKIGRQVKREMERRRRLLRIYVALLVVALLLGLLGLIYGAANPPPDAGSIANLIDNKSEEAASKFVRAEAQKISNSQQENFNALTTIFNTQLKNANEAAGQASEAASQASAAASEVRPILDRFESRLNSQGDALRQAANSQSNANTRLGNLENRPPPPPSQGAIAGVIERHAADPESPIYNALGGALTTASRDPESQVSGAINKAADRVLNEKAGELLTAQKFFADRPNTALVTYAALLARIERLEDELKKLQAQKCPACVPADGAGELTYGVKENSTSTIYGLGLEISLGAQSGGKIDRIIVRHPGEGGEVTKTQAAMGETFEFTTKRGTKYLITPVYIQRRRLAKDFIGMAIRRVPAPPRPPRPRPPDLRGRVGFKEKNSGG